MFFNEIGANNGSWSGDTSIALNEYIFPLLSMLVDELVSSIKMDMDGIIVMILHFHNFNNDFWRNSIDGVI